MATPVVSGAVALMLQKNPSLTPDQVKARLMKSAYKTFPRYSTAKDPTTGKSYTSQYDIFTVGAGYLDIQAALSSTNLAPATFGSAKSPAVARDKSGNVYVGDGFFRALGWLDHVGNFGGLGHVGAVGHERGGQVGLVGIVGSLGLQQLTTVIACCGERRLSGEHRTRTTAKRFRLRSKAKSKGLAGLDSASSTLPILALLKFVMVHRK